MSTLYATSMICVSTATRASSPTQCIIVQGGEAARQMRNAPQPKFWGGPANRSGHVQVQAQEALAHESPIMVGYSWVPAGCWQLHESCVNYPPVRGHAAVTLLVLHAYN